jgi:hypothetical protein
MEMTTKHTPGPWYVFHSAHRGRFDDDGPGAFSIGDAPIARSANILCSRYEWPERAEEMKANARLIAAAPELLEALQWYESKAKQMVRAAIHQDIKLMLELMKEIAVEYGAQARAAIAKATGKQP